MSGVFLFNGRDLRLTDNPGLDYAISERQVQTVGILKNPLFEPANHHQERIYRRALAELKREIGASRLRFVTFDSVSKLADHEIIMNANPCQPDAEQVFKSLSKATKQKITFIDDDWRLTRADYKTYYKFTPFYDHVIENQRSLIMRPSAMPKRSFGAQILQEVGDIVASRDDEEDGSGISPWLAIGAISIRQAWACVRRNYERFRRQLLWREFYYRMADVSPEQLDIHRYGRRYDMTTAERRVFDKWRVANTEWPTVNEKLRRLINTGKITNYWRMRVAEALIKDVPWWFGEDIFKKYLEDYDLVLNRANWIWMGDRELYKKDKGEQLRAWVRSPNIHYALT